MVLISKDAGTKADRAFYKKPTTPGKKLKGRWWKARAPVKLAKKL